MHIRRQIAFSTKNIIAIADMIAIPDRLSNLMPREGRALSGISQRVMTR